MVFRGFEAPKRTALANHLDALASDAGKLHSQLAAVLPSAQQNLPSGQSASRNPELQALIGDVIAIPSFFGGRRQLPGSLTGELGDMQSSMKRRIKQLEGVQELARKGYPVKKIDEALRNLRALEGKDFGTNGNRDDLEKVSGELDGLTAAEIDALMSKASPKDLAFYNELFTITDDSAWNPFDDNVVTPRHLRGDEGTVERGHRGLHADLRKTPFRLLVPVQIDLPRQLPDERVRLDTHVLRLVLAGPAVVWYTPSLPTTTPWFTGPCSPVISTCITTIGSARAPSRSRSSGANSPSVPTRPIR
ncbi:hypothetical protein ABTZ90_02325 [Streptomyces cellulosae]